MRALSAQLPNSITVRFPLYYHKQNMTNGTELVDKSVNLFFFNVLTVLQDEGGIISLWWEYSWGGELAYRNKEE